jgi:hypothetical protein
MAGLGKLWLGWCKCRAYVGILLQDKVGFVEM